MPLQTSGAISLLDIANEFGGDTPHGIDEYIQFLTTTTTTTTTTEVFTPGLDYEVRNQSNSQNPTSQSGFNAKFNGSPNSSGLFTQTINWSSNNNGSGGSNRPPNLPNSRFSWQVEGKIYAATAGLYRFLTTSDDGNQLTINGTIVTSFYGGRGVNQSSETGSITLSAGYHDFRYRMQQGAGAHGAIVQWRPPNVNSYSVIPTSVLGKLSKLQLQLQLQPKILHLILLLIFTDYLVTQNLMDLELHKLVIHSICRVDQVQILMLSV